MRLNCVNIATTNMAEMKTFYSLLLRAEGYQRTPGRCELSADNVTIVLTHTDIKTPVNPDCCGLEFYVDDVDAEYIRLTQAGIIAENEPVTLPWQYRYFAVKDPDGNHIDLVQYVGE